ncbi:MAG: hypothetical protein B6D61_05935 [Bacteroidetes bacterium 4484_249]|nr:MAG: hypothetical protein B6D61_05935 [Bacteroidetes bacterium 4484_249]
MKTKTEKTQEYNFVPDNRSGINPKEDVQSYKIINVSANEQIHDAVFNTLKYFSINGKKLNIFKVSTLQEAKAIAKKNPEVILIFIDNAVHVNGSYHDLERFVKEELNNSICQITFKDDDTKSSILVDKGDTKNGKSNSDFEYARERLVDVMKMIMLTCDMESKIEGETIITQDGIIKVEPVEEQISSVSITRDKLYTILAHDLKAPVGNIKVMLDFLTNEPELLDKRTSKELLMSVRESAESIHELLDNFLFWTRMHKNDIYFNPVGLNLANLVRENLTLLKSTAVSKKININSSIKENITVFADNYMITTVLRNLLYNAIKFTGKQGEISISVKEHTDIVEISIKDNGIGVPKKDIDKLFRPNVYLSTKSTLNETGTGLGLILCKDFIEKNGGQITAESEEGKGSTFSFTLPKWKNSSMN